MLNYSQMLSNSSQIVHRFNSRQPSNQSRDRERASRGAGSRSLGAAAEDRPGGGGGSGGGTALGRTGGSGLGAAGAASQKGHSIPIRQPRIHLLDLSKNNQLSPSNCFDFRCIYCLPGSSHASQIRSISSNASQIRSNYKFEVRGAPSLPRSESSEIRGAHLPSPFLDPPQ